MIQRPSWGLGREIPGDSPASGVSEVNCFQTMNKLILATIANLILVGQLATAQPGPGQVPGKPAPPPPRAELAALKLTNVEIDGLPLSEVLGLLSTVWLKGTPINVVTQPGLGEELMPYVKAPSIEVGTLLQLLSELSRVEMELVNETTLVVRADPSGGPGMMAPGMPGTGGMRPTEQIGPMTRTYLLDALPEGLKPEDVLSLARATWEAKSLPSPGTIKYHVETKTLILSGSTTHHEILAQALADFERSATKQASKKSEQEQARQASEAEKLRRDLETMSRRTELETQLREQTFARQLKEVEARAQESTEIYRKELEQVRKQLLQLDAERPKAK